VVTNSEARLVCRFRPPLSSVARTDTPKASSFPWVRAFPSPSYPCCCAGIPALAQSPWENAVQALQTSFTGPIARGLSLVAIVVGGLMFAFGEGESKRMLAALFSVSAWPLARSISWRGSSRRFPCQTRPLCIPSFVFRNVTRCASQRMFSQSPCKSAAFRLS
jgi:hypothetical protein